MYFFFFLICFCTFVIAENNPCDYVNNTHLLENTTAVLECFNTYVLPDHVTEGILAQLEVALQVYPYLDIAKNPPSYPSQEYYGKVDVEKAIEELDESLNKSGNVVSAVFRAVEKIITGFRDGHLYINAENTPLSENFFADIIYSLPFSWNYLPDSQGNFHVYIFSSQTGRTYDLGNQTYLDEMLAKGIYAETVDGKPAFEYFKEFLGKYNDMRANQARLHYARMNSIDGTSILQYPPEDDAFIQHVIKFSNGDEYEFNMTFLNSGVRAKRDVSSLLKRQNHPRGMSLDSEIKIRNILINHQPKILKDISKNKYALCSVMDDVNYISIPSFDCNGLGCETFEDEIVTCVSEFDKNSNPIVVNFPGNLGGATDISSLISALLNPNGDNEFVSAVRKTDITKILVKNGWAFADKLADAKCSDLDLSEDDEFEKFWEKTETDDYGNGVIHERTQLLSSYSQELQEKIETYRLKNNTRKPTDIIVVTDSVCFSACSFFVNNIIEKGAGIVTGVGGYNPGDKLFVASQNPSSVLTLSTMLPSLMVYVELSGVTLHCTFTETFPVLRGDNNLIPRDYTLSYIDKHLDVYPLVSHTTEEYDNETVREIIQNALAVREEFQENCNPNNSRLFFVTDNCTSSDENAMFVGYPCGSDGKWDKSKCLISSCKYGYHVDFFNNKCVPVHCIYPEKEPSSSSTVNSKSSGSRSKINVFVSIFTLVSILILSKC